jgi:hypothetical protein
MLSLPCMLAAQEIARDHVDPLQRQRVIQIPEKQIASNGTSVAIDCIIDLNSKSDTFYYLNFYIKPANSDSKEMMGFTKDMASTVMLEFEDGTTETFNNISGFLDNTNILPGEVAVSCSPASAKWKKIMRSRIVKVSVTGQSGDIVFDIPAQYRRVIPGMASVMYRYVL